LALQKDAITAFQAMGVGIPRHFIVVVDTCRRAGRLNDGLIILEELERVSETMHAGVEWALLHHIRGELLAAMDDLPAAEASFQNSIAVARRQSAKLFELRAANSLARQWCDEGRRIEARELLVPVYGWFTEGFDTPVLQEARALLEQLN
jgi:predicted ATPase